MVKQHQQKHQKQQQQQQLSATKATIRDSITKGKWHNGNRLLKLVCFGRASEVSGYLSCIWSALVVLPMILRNSPPASEFCVHMSTICGNKHLKVNPRKLPHCSSRHRIDDPIK